MASPTTVTSSQAHSEAEVQHKHIPARRHAVSWSPPKDLDDREWITVGRQLGGLSRCSQWWVGDWLRYGTARWGDRYALASRITGYDVRSLRNMAWVASCFKPSRRRDGLTWSHHATLAKLAPNEQDLWLDRAIAERLSVADLRVELRTRLTIGGSTEVAQPQTAPSTLTCPRCGLAIDIGAESA